MKELARPWSEDQRLSLGKRLAQGAVLGHPTSSVYGLGSAANRQGLEALNRVKGGERRGYMMLVSTRLWHSAWFAPSPLALRLAQDFWPGALSLVVQAGPLCPPELQARDGSVAVRQDAHPSVLDILDLLECPFLSTSANLAGEEPNPTPKPELWPEGVWAWIPEEASGALASTLVDTRGPSPRVLRQGSISAGMLAR